MGQNGPRVGTPAHLRALNQRLVLDRLRARGEATRPQIAAGTGLSKPTVGQALLDLEQHGLVRAAGRSLARVVSEEAEKLAYVVAAVTAVLDPRLIVLGGGIGGNADLLAPPMRSALATSGPAVPEIVAGQLGEDAVLAGAIATALGTARDLVFDRRGVRRAAEA